MTFQVWPPFPNSLSGRITTWIPEIKSKDFINPLACQVKIFQVTIWPKTLFLKNIFFLTLNVNNNNNNNKVKTMHDFLMGLYLILQNNF